MVNNGQFVYAKRDFFNAKNQLLSIFSPFFTKCSVVIMLPAFFFFSGLAGGVAADGAVLGTSTCEGEEEPDAPLRGGIGTPVENLN